MDKKDEQTVETPKQKANKAVHTAALGAATVAATPIPFADADPDCNDRSDLPCLW